MPLNMVGNQQEDAMPKKEQIKEFLHQNKDLLIFVADPKTDWMVVAYDDKFATVQFPFDEMENGIVFNALRRSKFNEAIDPFMSGIEKATGITVEDNQQLAHIIGGSIRSIGEARLKGISKKSNGKKK